MYNAFTHHALNDAQPVPEQRSAAPSQLPPVYKPNMISYDMEYPLGQFVSAVLAVLFISCLCTSSLPEQEKLKNS